MNNEIKIEVDNGKQESVAALLAFHASRPSAFGHLAGFIVSPKLVTEPSAALGDGFPMRSADDEEESA